MKPIAFHIIYLSVISILGFQLWTKTNIDNLIFQQIDDITEYNSKKFKGKNENQLLEIRKKIETNSSKYGAYDNNLKHFTDFTKNALQNVDSVLNIPKVDIVKVKDIIRNYSADINNLIDNKKEAEILLNESQLKKIIDDNDFWECVDKYPLIYKKILTQQIIVDEALYLDFFYNKVSATHVIVCGPIYKLAIVPKKAALIEGDTFEADMYIAQYYSNPNQNTSFLAGNDTLFHRDGVAHYKKKEKVTGLKTFEAKAIVKNRETGEEVVLKNQLQYHVLPKCSQDCQ